MHLLEIRVPEGEVSVEYPNWTNFCLKKKNRLSTVKVFNEKKTGSLIAPTNPNCFQTGYTWPQNCQSQSFVSPNVKYNVQQDEV